MNSNDNGRRTKKPRNKKRMIIWIVTLMAMGYGACYFVRDDGEVEYRTAIVKRGAITRRIVEEEGSFEPITLVKVSSEATGRVVDIKFKENDPVKKGDILAYINADNSRREVQKAEKRINVLCSRIEESKISIELSKIRQAADARHVSQNKVLAENEIIFVEELDASMDAYDIASLTTVEQELKLSSLFMELEEAKVNLEISESGLDNCLIRSPIDGMILVKNIEIGELVSSGQEVFQVCSDLGRMKFVALADDNNVVNIEIDQEILVKYKDYDFLTKVKEMQSNPIIENEIISYNVISFVDNDDYVLRPGMKGDYSLVFFKKENVLMLPGGTLKEAFKFSDNSKTVIIKRGDQFLKVSAKVGNVGWDGEEILSEELREGDQVVLAEQAKVKKAKKKKSVVKIKLGGSK